MNASVEQSPAESGSASQAASRRLRLIEGRLRPRLGEFWRWWTGALASWLPEATRDAFGLLPQRLLLQAGLDGLQPGGLQQQALQLALERGQVRSGLGQARIDDPATAADVLAAQLPQRLADVPRWLVLPAQAGLRRGLTLPQAAVERLRDVLAFEIDRQTPFSATDVAHDARVLARRGDGQVDVELVVVPKTMLEAALAGIGPLAATLAGVDVAGDDGIPLGVNLLPLARQRRRDDPARRKHVVLLLAALLALAAGMWQMLANRHAAAALFEQQVAVEVDKARLVAVEERKVIDLVEGTAFLRATRAARPTVVEVMDEITRRLPDSTYLEKFSIEGDRILMIGLSSEASSLVSRMEGSPLWRSPALAGALQPDPMTRMDRFTLVTELATLPAPATQEAAHAGRAP